MLVWVFILVLLLKSIVFLASHKRLTKIWLCFPHHEAVCFVKAFCSVSIANVEGSSKVCLQLGSQKKKDGLNTKILYWNKGGCFPFPEGNWRFLREGEGKESWPKRLWDTCGRLPVPKTRGLCLDHKAIGL